MNVELLEQAVNKTMVNRKEFPRSDQAFRSFHAAEVFCKEQGFSVGRMQRDSPIGIKRGEWDIQKWRNLDRKDRKLMDGAILGSDKRHGPILVVWCDEQEEA
jgi:hypothetical protein